MVTFSKIGDFGRLGNQLFQIALIINYANKYNYEWGIKNWIYKKFFKNEIKEYIYENNKSLFNYEYYDIKFKEILDLGSNVDFLGYFQSEKYFLSSKEEIKIIFTPKTELIDNIKKNNSSLFIDDECFIHIRRGDYIDLGHVLDMNYYKKSIEEMKKNGVKKFFIVSDDIDWCKIKFIGNEFYFSKNKVDIEDLFFMSLFKNAIIANSSFSWWGAYLGEEKNVICPKVPFSDWHTFEDYYPEKWTKI
jgi:hypothetical protein